MTARKDSLAKDILRHREKAKESNQNRFGGRYKTRVNGTGHMLNAVDTKALILEQLSDHCKPGAYHKYQAVNVVATEIHDPPDEVELKMLNAVDPRYRTPHMMVNFRAMVRAWTLAQMGLNLTNGSGDC